MHIAEGVLSPPILAAGYALTAVGTALGLRRLNYDKLMTVTILAATFFVGSLIHVPIGPSSAHLILNGLLGVLLGWAVFPAILAARLPKKPVAPLRLASCSVVSSSITRCPLTARFRISAAKQVLSIPIRRT